MELKEAIRGETEEPIGSSGTGSFSSVADRSQPKSRNKAKTFWFGWRSRWPWNVNSPTIPQ